MADYQGHDICGPFSCIYKEDINKNRAGTDVIQDRSTKISEMMPNGMDWGSGPFPVTFLFVHLPVKQLQQKENITWIQVSCQTNTDFP